MSFPLRFAALPFVLLVAGCASSTTGRIKEKAVLFQSLSPDEQGKIENGEVELGYSRDMVYMALGKPTSIQRSDAEGSAETWVYRNYFPPESASRKGSVQKPMTAPPPHVGGGSDLFGGSRPVSDQSARGVLTDVPRGSSGGGGPTLPAPPVVTLQIVFRDGRVDDFKIIR